MTDDRRHYSRIAFASPAQLLVDQQHLAVRLLDISLKGALVSLPERADLRTGAACLLHVQLDETGDAISMQATVAHGDTRQAGLVCNTIDIDSITHLRRLVELNLGDADLLQRELSALVSE